MQFTANSHRFDPYKNFKFRIKWDGRYVAGVSKISALKRSTELVNHREGGDVSSDRISPGRSKFEPVTIERGVTHDPEFEAWSNLVHSTDGDAAMSLKDFRKDVIVELLNLQGNVAKAYKLYRCWVSEYQAMPELDANANAIAIEMMVLQCEGWERDESVTEPTES
ncbi:phage tail protein [Pleionea litopenaei]|uniref:Phage tail protein n=1 Tax=Pleionea litopenaei TaxID=3070815 RepID=A0AA51X6Z7_9GAMM|nr:phage tail protein [Pleionea sp. HL-JVS1]WMS87802.1 phage tail protein [Pleionea sp. HL-JVS1]